MLYVEKSVVKQHVRKTKTGKVALVHQYTNAKIKNSEVLLPENFQLQCRIEEARKKITSGYKRVFDILPNLIPYVTIKRDLSQNNAKNYFNCYMMHDDNMKAYAQCQGLENGHSQIFLNSKYFKSDFGFNMLLSQVNYNSKAGWGPIQCDKLEYIIVHELGHAFYNALWFKLNKRFRKVRKKAKELFEEMVDIAYDFPASEYAKTNRHEAFAEMFAKVFFADDFYYESERRFKKLIKEADSCLQ